MSEQLGRAVRILDELGRAEGDLTIRELAERVGLPKSSVQRLLRGLVDTELATQYPATQAYRLGPRALALGMAYLRKTDLRTVALPHLSELRDRTGETVGLSIALGEEMYHIEQVQSTADLRRAFTIGRGHPLWAGAPSRLLLGGFSDADVRRILAERPHSEVVPVSPPSAEQMLQEVRRAGELGYAMAFEETIIGVHTVAAAVRLDDSYAAAPYRGPAAIPAAIPGAIPAAIAVTGPSVRFTVEAIQDCLPDVLTAARRVASELGGALAPTSER